MRKTILAREPIKNITEKGDYEDEMLSIKYFKKNSAHITFRKPELVDRLNNIIAKYYQKTLSFV